MTLIVMADEVMTMNRNFALRIKVLNAEENIFPLDFKEPLQMDSI